MDLIAYYSYCRENVPGTEDFGKKMSKQARVTYKQRRNQKQVQRGLLRWAVAVPRQSNPVEEEEERNSCPSPTTRRPWRED